MFNQHRVVSRWQQIDSDYTSASFIKPGGLYLPDGLDFYSAAMSKYDYTSLMNNRHGVGKPITVNSWYGQPYEYQAPRNIRLEVHFTF